MQVLNKAMFETFGSLRCLFFFSSRRRHTRSLCDWSSDVCSSDLLGRGGRRIGLSGGGQRENGRTNSERAPQVQSFVHLVPSPAARSSPSPTSLFARMN